MPNKEKTLAENIANLGEDATLSGFIASIEEIGKKDPEKLAAAGGFLKEESQERLITRNLPKR